MVLFLGVCYWAGDKSNRLTHEEVDAYIAKMQQGSPMTEPEKGEVLARLRVWGDADDGGQCYLVNLLRFKNPSNVGRVAIKTTTAEARNQFCAEGTATVALRVSVWPRIRMKAQGTGRGTSSLEGLATENDGWTRST